MYRLVASVGADAHKSAINEDDDILTVLGGKASCRRKFVINVHLLDENSNTVNEELTITASVAYAHDRSPIVQDDTLFLAEPPLLTTFNGVEYPSQDRPTRLVGGKASFKLAISLLSSKYDNRLFCICFTPQPGISAGDLLGSRTMSCLPEPCYSKPIRSISRKRSSSTTAPPLPISHHVLPQSDCAANSHPSKVKSPESNASEELEKFFRVGPATSSSEEDDKANYPNTGDVGSESASLRYISSNNYKQEAQLLLRPDAIHGNPYYSLHDTYSTRKSPFLPIDTAHCDGYLIRNDPAMHLETTNYNSFSGNTAQTVDCFGRPCILMDAFQHRYPHQHQGYDGIPSLQEELSLIAENALNHEGFSIRKEAKVHMDGQHNEALVNRSLPSVKEERSADSYMDSPGSLGKPKMLMKGCLSPNPATSRSESTSPISAILTSDGSMEHNDAFSQPPSITAATTIERPLSASHPGSRLNSPFRPYNPNAGPARVHTDSQRSSSRSPPYQKGLHRESPETLPVITRPIPDQVMQSALDASSSKRSLDKVLQRLLTDARSHEMNESCSLTGANVADEEQSLLALEATLQDAIQELERKKEELRMKRQHLLEEDEEACIHNAVFQSSSWVESLARKYNY
ncbi:hypothetical protein KP509_20G077200 [Ceratopteris richardii]|uniref:Uncharacterized protein n=1 Tax=Ceratopteris richardii TaxID=49495 RepID=A0A8T2SH86_CERRI|nr:hypothetical protein KP509_20G077200 [Ceratopteris richardii]